MSDDPDLVVVTWRGGAQARVSRKPYQWIVDNVIEATTPEDRAGLYDIGCRLRALLAAGEFPIERDPTTAARRRFDSSVVKAWDRLMAALADHPTYNGDHITACGRHGVDVAAAAKYADALRDVVDGYRPKSGIRRGGPRGGGPMPSTRRAWMADAAIQIQGRFPDVREKRATEIVAGLVQMLGADASAGSIRDATRKRRL